MEILIEFRNKKILGNRKKDMLNFIKENYLLLYQFLLI
jgi:hypothetical protein